MLLFSAFYFPFLLYLTSELEKSGYNICKYVKNVVPLQVKLRYYAP